MNSSDTKTESQHASSPLNIPMSVENSRVRLPELSQDVQSSLLQRTSDDRIMYALVSPPDGTTFVLKKYAGTRIDEREVVGSHIDRAANVFIRTAVMAYAEHLPLRIKPDHILELMTNAFDCWLTDFGGNSLLSLPKRDITVQITTWDDAIEALSAEICNQIPEALRSILIHKFTTTTQNMHQAHTFTVTNAYREFVCVTFETLCGISNILLDGTEADWRSLKDIANAMLTVSQGKLAPWINSLQSALDLMIASFTEITPTMKDMWCRFISHGTLYKKNATSGWINVFFPYVYRAHFLAYTTEYKLEQNHMVWEWGWDVIHNPPYECDGIEYSKFPTTAMRQKFPLRNILDGTTSTIEVTAGLVATIQWPDGALESFLSYQVVMSSE